VFHLQLYIINTSKINTDSSVINLENFQINFLDSLLNNTKGVNYEDIRFYKIIVEKAKNYKKLNDVSFVDGRLNPMHDSLAKIMKSIIIEHLGFDIK